MPFRLAGNFGRDPEIPYEDVDTVPEVPGAPSVQATMTAAQNSAKKESASGLFSEGGIPTASASGGSASTGGEISEVTASVIGGGGAPAGATGASAAGAAGGMAELMSVIKPFLAVFGMGG